jgi:hypothetical protein
LHDLWNEKEIKGNFPLSICHTRSSMRKEEDNKDSKETKATISLDFSYEPFNIEEISGQPVIKKPLESEIGSQIDLIVIT